MNKTQLVDALTARLGDRRLATTALDGVLDTIVETVGSGDTVAIAGFGVFEARSRAARTTRHPRTGAVVDVPAATVPAFRPGSGFRAAVAGTRAAVVVEEAVEVAPAPKKGKKSSGKKDKKGKKKSGK